MRQASVRQGEVNQDSCNISKKLSKEYNMYHSVEYIYTQAIIGSHSSPRVSLGIAQSSESRTSISPTGFPFFRQAFPDWNRS